MSVNVYFALIAAVSIAVLLIFMNHGIRRGFARELKSVLSLGAGIGVIMLLAGAFAGFRTGKTSNLILCLVLLAAFGVVYRLVHLLVSGIGVIAGLPLISWLDSALGLAAGLLEGFGVLYWPQYIGQRKKIGKKRN